MGYLTVYLDMLCLGQQVFRMVLCYLRLVTCYIESSCMAKYVNHIRHNIVLAHSKLRLYLSSNNAPHLTLMSQPSALLSI
jgi:hypothetical protein